ncbi:MAG: 50S ribosomal protein L23 [bacterium]|jgi:large subunit ribosomal protein L23|nr:50S ribosomal protein L23 [bacterium]
MPNKWEVIQEAVFTERTTALSEKENTFTFKVHPAANKVQIKEAVEEAFKVKVVDVRTVTQKPRKRVDRYRGIIGKTNRVKKAMVKLAKGHTIEFA